MKIRKNVVFYIFLGFMSCALLGGCDWIYGLLQKEGAEEKSVLGNAEPSIYNPKVEELQQLLKLYGYFAGEPDGKFGPNTRRAVLRFQETQGLEVTKFVDKKTWERLMVFKNVGLVSRGQIDVKMLQTALKNAGFDVGKVDGQMGGRTSRMLKEFQRAHGLKPDGVIGFRTLNELTKYIPVDGVE